MEDFISAKISSGYNGALANANIKAFADGIKDTVTAVVSAYDNLITKLYECWISPKAKAFSMTYEPKMTTMIEKAINNSNGVISKAVSAVSRMAESHDSSFHYSGGSITIIKVKEIQLRDFDGSFFGIKPAKANEALNEFITGMTKALTILNSVPDSIAVKNAGDSISTLYKDNISEIKGSIESATSSIHSEIKSAIDEFQQAVAESDKAAMAILDEAFESVLKI